MSKCPICNSEAESRSPGGLDGEEVNCPRCGHFRISRSAAINWRRFADGERQVANACGWIREHQNKLIVSEIINTLDALPTPSFEERKRKLLLFLKKQSITLGQRVELNNILLELMSACWCTSNEISFLLSSAEECGLIEHKANGVRLTARGYDYLDQIDVNTVSQIGFCAMWFDKSVEPLWNGAIEPAISNAGYQPLRIDKKEHVNRIDDEIFADIRRSRFVIADFTHGEKGIRGGVYFEAGFAQGLGLPVIWTCRSDMLSENKLHFDIRQYNFLEWSDETLDEFKDRLQKRIEVILGRGTWKPGA